MDRLVEDPADATMDLVLEAPLLLERIRLYIARNEPEEMMPKWRIPEIQIFEPGKDSAERCSSSNESSIEVNSDSN